MRFSLTDKIGICLGARYARRSSEYVLVLCILNRMWCLCIECVHRLRFRHTFSRTNNRIQLYINKLLMRKHERITWECNILYVCESTSRAFL